MKKLLIFFLLIPIFASSQTFTKTSNVKHGDTVFLKTTVSSYVLDSTEKFIYINHYNIDTVNVGDTAISINYTLINDTSSYFQVFKVVTGEAWVLHIRLNNTTDTQIASVSLNTSERIFTNSSLNIAVAAGDYIEIKSINPTWVTNPLTCIFGGYIYIE